MFSFNRIFCFRELNTIPNNITADRGGLMFQGQSISELIALFKRRNVKLYHACQLKDFTSYLKLGGIPSRNLLKKNRCNFTKFDTDDNDIKNKVDSCVFLNMNDFSNFYHSSTNSVPSPFGPILIILEPKSLENFDDIAICLRSAGASGFNGVSESLTTTEEVNRLFKNGESEKYSFYLKDTRVLAEEFSSDSKKIVKGFPEISGRTPSEILNFESLIQIVVDPIENEETTLIKIIEERTKGTNLQDKAVQRASVNPIYTQLVSFVAHGASTLGDLKNCEMEGVQNWAKKCQENQNLQFQFKRFAKYTREGTLCEMGKIWKKSSGD